MSTSSKDLALPSTQATVTGATLPGSTPKQRDESQRTARRLELGRKLVEASKRMETDLEYRRETQSMTR